MGECLRIMNLEVSERNRSWHILRYSLSSCLEGLRKITKPLIQDKSRDSSVGIATGYGLDDRSSMVPFPGEGGWEFFSSQPRPKQLWGPLRLLSSGYRGGGSFPGGKAAEA
jgi:hypothetical protein